MHQFQRCRFRNLHHRPIIKSDPAPHADGFAPQPPQIDVREPQRPNGLRLDRNLKTGCIAEFNDLPAPDIKAAPNFALDDFKPGPARRNFIRRLEPELSIAPVPRSGRDPFALCGIEGAIAKTGSARRINSYQPAAEHRLLKPNSVGENLRSYALITIGNVEDRKTEIVPFQHGGEIGTCRGKNFRGCRAAVLNRADYPGKTDFVSISAAEGRRCEC